MMLTWEGQPLALEKEQKFSDAQLSTLLSEDEVKSAPTTDKDGKNSE